jgi:signal transduction histidine kinase
MDPRHPDMNGRLRLVFPVALAACLLVATALIVAIPSFRFSAGAPHLRPVLETGSAVVAALTAAVAYLRFSLDRDRLWLFVSLAFLVVTVNQLVLEVLLPGIGITGPDPTYLWLVARLEMGLLLLIAVAGRRVPWHPEWSAAKTYVVAGGLALGALAFTQTAILLGAGHVAATGALAGGAPGLETADVLVGSIGAAVFLVAAGGLLLSSDRAVRADGALVWLSVALVIAAFGNLHYLLEPTLFTDSVSTGDLLRVVMAAILVIAVLVDVRRSYAEERERATQLAAAVEAQTRRVLELEELDRMQAEIHRMVNHELLHPVAAIRTLAVTLSTKWDRLDEDDKLLAVEGVLYQSEQLRDLAGRTPAADLRFDRELHRDPKRVDEVVRRVERTFPHLRERLVFDPDHLPREDVIDVDERRLMQVFHNLLSNAARFSPQGSPILLATQGDDEEVVFCVDDIGPGVPSEDAHRLFVPFSRLHPATGNEGTGLGLYIARQIVEAHGGRIWVEPSYGGGASFRFSVPVTQRENA